jgi:hypothetical protein
VARYRHIEVGKPVDIAALATKMARTNSLLVNSPSGNATRKSVVRSMKPQLLR